MARRSRRMRPNRSRATRISSMSAPKRTRSGRSSGSCPTRGGACGKTRTDGGKALRRLKRRSSIPTFQLPTPNHFQLPTANSQFEVSLEVIGSWDLEVESGWELGVGNWEFERSRIGPAAKPLRNDSLRELIRHRALLLSHAFGVQCLSL